MQTKTLAPSGAFNPSRRFIRVRNERADGFVEFDFAVGDAELSVELILPRGAFEAFARLPNTERMSEEAAAHAEGRMRHYLYGPTEQHTQLTQNNS